MPPKDLYAGVLAEQIIKPLLADVNNTKGPFLGRFCVIEARKRGEGQMVVVFLDAVRRGNVFQR